MAAGKSPGLAVRCGAYAELGSIDSKESIDGEELCGLISTYLEDLQKGSDPQLHRNSRSFPVFTPGRRSLIATLASDTMDQGPSRRRKYCCAWSMCAHGQSFLATS